MLAAAASLNLQNGRGVNLSWSLLCPGFFSSESSTSSAWISSILGIANLCCLHMILFYFLRNLYPLYVPSISSRGPAVERGSSIFPKFFCPANSQVLFQSMIIFIAKKLRTREAQPSPPPRRPPPPQNKKEKTNKQKMQTHAHITG